MVAHTFNPRIGIKGRWFFVSSRPPSVTQRLNLSKRGAVFKQRWSQNLGSYSFNPRIRKVETGAVWLGGERRIRGKRQELSGEWNLRLVESIAPSHLCLSLGRRSIWWLGCFASLIIGLSLNICLWDFIIPALTLTFFSFYSLRVVCVCSL